ncbi:MAG: 7-cyano-7-deazaguanine synthase, partial [Verrucomicrobiae bacterium]|nr:7-cyano-7-deazaguanine synthase [Verrucomicrobiae bacterium]
MKTVLVYSGGMDSTVLLYHLLKEGATVAALSVDYGQRHKKELDLAREITQTLGVEHRVADLTTITGLLGGSSLTDPELRVPH